MTNPTPPPIFDAAELRRIASACPDSTRDVCRACNEWHTNCTCHDRYLFRTTFTKPTVLALFDERATLLARVEAAEAERDSLREQLHVADAEIRELETR